MTGDAIRAARERLGLTQAEAARRCGMARQNWRRLERGASSPTVATLQRVAEGLGLELMIVLAGEDPDVEDEER